MQELCKRSGEPMGLGLPSPNEKYAFFRPLRASGRSHLVLAAALRLMG
jgi:hypothetical protein